MAEDLPRRRYPRVNAENVVLIKRLGDPPLEGFAKTRVMGRGGCMLVSDESLGVDAPLELLLSFCDRVVRTHCRVAYEIPKSPGEIEVGIEFLDISVDDQEFLDQVLSGVG